MENGQYLPFELGNTGGWGEVVSALHEGGVSKTLPALKAEPQIAMPVCSRNKILCVGLNYVDHAAEGKQDVPKYPNIFIRYKSSFVKEGDDIILPKISEKLDYEAELVIVIGRSGRYIKKENALSHVFGYMLGMDGSVRDFQKRVSQWGLGKNFDNSGALGNYIITADELPDGAKNLEIISRLNSSVMQRDNTSNMIFDVPSIIAGISESMTLNPGDLILTGTPAGVGFARTPPVFMKNGDELEIEIEKIGVMRNKIRAEK